MSNPLEPVAYIYIYICICIEGARGVTTPWTFLSENLELVGKFEGGYLTKFCLLKSEKTFRTRNIKNWTFVDHRNNTILQ